jgi:hypothetical protein
VEVQIKEVEHQDSMVLMEHLEHQFGTQIIGKCRIEENGSGSSGSAGSSDHLEVVVVLEHQEVQDQVELMEHLGGSAEVEHQEEVLKWNIEHQDRADHQEVQVLMEHRSRVAEAGTSGVTSGKYRNIRKCRISSVNGTSRKQCS